MKHVALAESIFAAGPAPELEAVLSQPRPEEHGPYAPFHSRNPLFEAMTEAFRLRRMQPDTPLAERPIPGNGDTRDLSGMLTRVINESLGKEAPASTVFSQSSPLPPRVVRPEHTPNEESGFLATALFAGSTLSARLYQRNGVPVFLKKFAPLGDETSLSLFDTEYNGITVPKGTIFAVQDYRHTPKIRGLEVKDTADIDYSYPIRLSRFALSAVDREASFPEFETSGFFTSLNERTATTESIRAALFSTRR